MAGNLARLLEPHVPEDLSSPVLDIGCGFGFTLRALSQLGCRNLVGVECSEEQAAIARQAGFHVALTDNTPAWLLENPCRFSLVVLFDVLEHVPVGCQIDFLRAIHAALAPRGTLVLTVPNANAILASRWRYIDYTHLASFTEHSLHFVLRNAGFEKIEMANNKGLGPMPWRLWHSRARVRFRRWLVRWCWLQVFKAELGWEKLDAISFDLNLKTVATK